MKLTLALFVDALGWEVLQRHPFLENTLPFRKPLNTIFGYSSACDPAIISGKMPDQTGHWSSFYFSPESSPFKPLWPLSYLPPFLTKRARVRNILSRFSSRFLGFTGYFQLYNVPFEHLTLFDYVEKRRMWEKNGLVKGQSIFDTIEDKGLPYYAGDQDPLEQQLDIVQNKDLSFAYVFFGALDALMHKEGPYGKSVPYMLQDFEQKIEQLIQSLKKKYDEIDIFCFSDHGMHQIKEVVDVEKEIHKLPLKYGKDYVAFYDSTMARFWYINDKARKQITQCLEGISKGRILTKEELKSFGTYFPSNQFGETIFLLDPHVLLVPSFMGLKPIEGMHGYDPKDKDSLAAVMSNRDSIEKIEGIEGLYMLFKKSIFG